MGVRQTIRSLCAALQDRKYAGRLAGKKMTYEQWLASVCERRERMGKRAEERTDEADKEPKKEGGIVLLRMQGGILAAEAAEAAEHFFAGHPQAVLAYGDEDVIDSACGRRSRPLFKPDWSPDTFLSRFYWGRVAAVRREWLSVQDLPDCVDFGRTDGEVCFEGTLRQWEETVLRLVCAAGGFKPGCRAIGHIPEILFHAEEGCGAAKDDVFWADIAANAAVDATADATANAAADAAANVTSDATATVSVIIPSKDHPATLGRCLDALFETRGDCPLEVLVVDNGSTGENRAETERILRKAPVPCRYLYEPMEFNFAKMCNLGAAHARGELLLFLNDDVEASSAGWLQKMAQKALLPYEGAVGLKLYYPGTRRIQHDGVAGLPMGPVHKLQYLPDEGEYYGGYNVCDRNVSAVTGACLMVRKDRFVQAGGMDEELQVAFNDVDLCIRLLELGYYNTVINSAFAYHWESLSRGDDASPEKLRRLALEKERLFKTHPAFAGRDPFYSPLLNTEYLDTAIRPAFVTGRNAVQCAGLRICRLDLSRYRRDECLLLRLERYGEDCIQGYGVVLGDDNACYDRRLLLWKTGEGEEGFEPSGLIECFGVPLKEQYRPDLEENMADQKNVALCGFWLKIAGREAEGGGLPDGEYRIGMTASRKAGRTRLINWSNAVVRVGRP